MTRRQLTSRITPISPQLGTARSINPKRLIVLLGDDPECLRTLKLHPDVMVVPAGSALHDRPTAAVIQRDWSAITGRREFGARLRGEIPIFANICAKSPSIRRLILIIQGPAGVPRSVMRRKCEAVEGRIHWGIEQHCGAYVILTILLVDGCDNPALLARRVHDRALQPQGIDATVTLTWEEIERRPIGCTAANRYL